MKDKTKKSDAVFGFISLGLSFWIIAEASRYDYMTEFATGPGFMPLWIGVVLGLFSLSLIYDGFKRNAGAAAERDKEIGLPDRKALARVGLILLMIAGLAFFMMYVGFALAVALFVFLVLFFLEGYSMMKSILYGIAFSALIFLIFQYWLEVELPIGYFGF
jgi:hypothetical protein